MNDTDDTATTDTQYSGQDIWLNPMLMTEHVSEGDEVVFRFFADDGNPNTENPSGDLTTVSGTVTKIVDGATGGIFIDPAPEKSATPTYKLHLIEGGTVTGTHKYGNRTISHGLRAKIKLSQDML